MIIKKKLRLSTIKPCKNNNGNMISFLDENDDKLVFWFDNDKSKKYLNAKQYDIFEMDLQIYKSSKNAQYNIGVI